MPSRSGGGRSRRRSSTRSASPVPGPPRWRPYTTPSRHCTSRHSRGHWAGGRRRSPAGGSAGAPPSCRWRCMARDYVASTAKNCQACGWSPSTTCKSASCWRKRGVRTRDESEEGKQEAELRVAPTLLRAVPLSGRVVTGDALSCQHALCRPIRQADGHFLFAVKANQPDLATEVARLFDQPPPREGFGAAHSHGPPGNRPERPTPWAP